MKKQSLENLLSRIKGMLVAGVLVAGVFLCGNQAFATETDDADAQETETTEVTDGESTAAVAELPAPTYDIPDSADFSYEEVLYKPIDHYDPAREPMNGERISVNYKGEVIPAYYWAPGDMVVFQVSLADTDIPKFEELSQEDQDTWTSFLSDSYATPAEAYYAEMLPTYTFYYNFDENKIVPFVEFDYGKEGKVIMMPYDKEEQGFYLEELSPSFLKLGNFEFETYQFLSINDDTCYHILSCMDQVGNVYLYQYDANGNSCARADLNMLIGLRYLAERTIALNEYIDKVQTYQDNIRKIIAGVIIFVILVGFAFIYVVFGKRKKDDDDDEDDEDDEDDDDKIIDELEETAKEEIVATSTENELNLEAIEEEYGITAEEVVENEEVEEENNEETEEEFVLPEIELEPEALEIDDELPVIQLEEVESIDEISEEAEETNKVSEAIEELSDDGFVPEFEDGDPTEGGLFFAADTDEMKALFKETDEEPKRGRLRAFLNGDDIEDDEDDEDEDDIELEDDFEDKKIEPESEVEETIVEAETPEIPEHQKKTLASIFDDDDEEEDDEEEEEEKPRRVKKEKKVKEKKVKEKKVKEKPEKKKRRVEDDDDDEGDDEILDLEDL